VILSSDVGRNPSPAGAEDCAGRACWESSSVMGVVFATVEANRGAKGPARYRSGR
jgi:hypothetical protein